jgi:hypothetical protein
LASGLLSCIATLQAANYGDLRGLKALQRRGRSWTVGCGSDGKATGCASPGDVRRAPLSLTLVALAAQEVHDTAGPASPLRCRGSRTLGQLRHRLPLVLPCAWLSRDDARVRACAQCVCMLRVRVSCARACWKFACLEVWVFPDACASWRQRVRVRCVTVRTACARGVCARCLSLGRGFGMRACPCACA